MTQAKSQKQLFNAEKLYVKYTQMTQHYTDKSPIEGITTLITAILPTNQPQTAYLSIKSITTLKQLCTK